MANKEFKIQGNELSLNGVTLSSSADGKLVLPGVTRATGYEVDEVDDGDNQTLTFSSVPTVIDYIVYNALDRNEAFVMYATYEVTELDGEGYIDGIDVTTRGSYTSLQSASNSSNNMYAYTGVEADPFASFVAGDWTAIPFRPKMQSTGVESELGTDPFVALPDWIEVVSGTNHLPNLNEDYGWDSSGVWTTNASIAGDNEGTSYPIRTAFTIPSTTKTIVTVEFVMNNSGADFGIGAWQDGVDPIWMWDGTTGNVEANRIGAQYNGVTPELHGIIGGAQNPYGLPSNGTYIARFTIDPTPGDHITVTLETLDINETLLDTITYDEQMFTGDYRIGFASDQDNGTTKTYMHHLTIELVGDTTYEDTLQSGSSAAITTAYTLSRAGYEASLDDSGNFIVPGNIVVGNNNTGNESHFVIDSSNYWTSIQWKNFDSPQDPSAEPFECQSQLLRVFENSSTVTSECNIDNPRIELVALTAIRNNGTRLNGLMISTSDDKIPDAPYNNGEGTRNDWIFGGDAVLKLPVDGDIVNSDGQSVIKTLPQNLQDQNSDYTLVLSDAGKHIYKADGNNRWVYVPTNDSVPFPIGTVVTIVSGSSWTYINAADTETTSVYGAGFNQTSSYWYIPNNSMATLLKIGTDTWMLSGAGLGID